MEPLKNEHTEFVGLEALKAKQAAQLSLFEEWALNNDWLQFHFSHYDWWMYPISQPSQFGFAYVVYENEIQQLKHDPDFIRNYLRGVELLLLSWGWDLWNEIPVPEPATHQHWYNWPIRLHKCATSLKEFGFETEFNSVRKYARLLINQGVSFDYNGTDLSLLFA